MEAHEFLKKHIDTALYAIKLDEVTKSDLLQKYDLVALAKIKNDTTLLKNDVENLNILLNKTLFISTLKETDPIKLMDYTNLSGMKKIIDNALKDSNETVKYMQLYKDLAGCLATINGKAVDVTDSDAIVCALQTFGLETVNPEELDIEVIGEVDDELKLNTEGLDIFDENDIELSMDELDEVEEPNLEDLELDEEDLLNDMDLEDNEDTNKNENVNTEEEDDTTRKELEESISNIYSTQINKTVDDLLGILSALYESGFSSMPQAGILVNNGDDSSPLISIKTSKDSGTYKMTSKTDGGTIYDYKIMKVISNVIPELATYAVTNDKEALPSINSMMGMNVVCHKLHLQFQTANIKFCTGRTSIRKWITETQLKDGKYANADEWIQKVNKGKTVLVSYKSMIQPWYRWSLKRFIIDSFIEYGVKSLKDEALANQVLEAITNNVKNIVVESERDIGEKAEIKISYSKAIDVDKIIQALTDELNIGNSRSIEIKQIAQQSYNTHGVLTLSIIYDKKAANKANLFAGDIVDKLVESGNEPTWNHALLGKKEDGTYFFWDDFMDPDKAQPEKRCYTIYAGSRSGKGVMTSTLMAAALCDRKQIFYTDGKPENGVCLGEIAWSKGKEAYVFNGTPDGKDPYPGPMEQYAAPMRTNTEIADYLGKLPKCLFENSKYFKNADQEKFLAVMRYLKSMTLCASIIEARAAGKLNRDVWQVWVFDEMTAMSRQEKEIRHLFALYLIDKDVKIKTSMDITAGIVFEAFNKDKNLAGLITPNSETYDAGVEYIYKWQTWNENIISNIANAAVISLGKADMNLIFIFQEPSWLSTDATKTTICKVVKSLKSTKIAGSKAIPRQAGEAAGEYGDATMKQDWIDKINSGNGWWVISKSSNIKSSDVTLFKPFTVWTKYLKEGAVPEDEKTRYLAGYVEKLLGSFGIEPSDLLQSSFDYASNAVTEFGFANSLKEFIYDCSNFALINGDSSYSNVIDKLSNGENGEEPTSQSTNKLNISEEEDEETKQQETKQQETKQQETNRKAVDAKQLKFMTTVYLMRAEYDDNTLSMYMSKFILSRAMRNQFNYADTAQNSSTGLRMASIVYSSLYYYISRGLYNINEFNEYANSLIASGRDTENKYKLALGILGSLSNGSLQIDQIPTSEQMMSWLEQYLQMSEQEQEINSMFTNEIDGIVRDFGDGAENFANEPLYNDVNSNVDAKPEIDMQYQNPFFAVNQMGKTVINPRETQNVLNIPMDMFIEVSTESYSTIERFKKKLFESRNGTAYEFKKRWELVLKGIKKLFPNSSMVNRFTIAGGQVTVNGKVILIDGVLGGEYDIRLEDIVRIKDTMKTFPKIQQLVLDSEATNQLLNEYGRTAQDVWKLFQDNPSLKALGLIPNGAGEPIVYLRHTFGDSVDRLNKQLANDGLRAQFEQLSAQKNPRLHEKSPGYMQKIYKNGKSISSKSFQVAGAAFFNDKDPKVLKAFGYSLIGTAAICIGAAAGLTGWVGNKVFNRN